MRSEFAHRIRHYAEPDRPYTLCGEKIVPRDVHADWPDCTSCVKEVVRYWGEKGAEVAREVNTHRLRERDAYVHAIMDMIEAEEWTR